MKVEPSAWRTSDLVRYETARDVAGSALALLFRLADTGLIELSAAVEESAALRQDLVAVNGFDRDDVDAFIDRVDARIAELKGIGR